MAFLNQLCKCIFSFFMLDIQAERRKIVCYDLQNIKVLLGITLSGVIKIPVFTEYEKAEVDGVGFQLLKSFVGKEQLLIDNSYSP